MSAAILDETPDLDPAAVVAAALGPPSPLRSDALLDDIVALERLKAWADARQQRLLAHLDHNPAPRNGPPPF